MEDEKFGEWSVIDTEHGGKFVTYVTAPSYAWERPDHHDQMWAYLRQQLTRKFYDEIFINFLNGGWYTFNLLLFRKILSSMEN